MIDAAIATGDAGKVATIAELARTTNPDDTAEVDAMVAGFTAQQQHIAAEQAAAREAEIRAAPLFAMWKGEGQLGGFRSTGNTSSAGLSAGLKLNRVGIDWRHKLLGRIDYQRTNGATTREQYSFAYEPNYHFNPRLYAYGLGQFEHDRIQGFTSRISASGGLGYKVIARDRMKLSTKAGPALRATDYTDTSDETSLAGLLGVDFDWHLAEKVKLTQDANAYFQASNSSFDSTTGLEAQINGSLTARVAYVVEHDTNPPAGAVRTDTLTRLTLIYGF
ncbi:MAG: DUF481 domain-containing protein [Sphingomonadales bacterium]|nr:DUF481 domain-containing protein [Sphingomonadales bacterium]MBD3774538.1 DUF481 domain-containing protein [Paracoccaceae bacterium]